MAPAAAGGVGFSRIVIGDPMGGAMLVSLWYPTRKLSGEIEIGPFTFQATRDAEPTEGRHGLVVLSHGSVGSDLGRRNLGIALARAGLIAAAPLHPRDNYRDSSGALARRPLGKRPMNTTLAP